MEPVAQTPERAPQHETFKLSHPADAQHISKVVLAGFGAILVIISALGAGYFLGSNKQNGDQTYVPVPTAAPDIQLTGTPESRSDWKTYTSTTGKYSVQYPSTYTLYENEVFGVDGVTLKRPNTLMLLPPHKKFQLAITHTVLAKQTNLSDFIKSYDDCIYDHIITYKKETLTPETMGSNSFSLTKDTACGPKGETHLFISPDMKTYYDVFIETSGQYADVKEEVSKILATFTVTDPTISKTVAPGPVIPADWKQFTDKDSSFGIQTSLFLPPGYTFSFTGSEWMIYDSSSNENWDYSTSVFMGKNDTLKNWYAGESRRVWFQKYLSDEFSANTTPVKKGDMVSAKEISIGAKSYLEVKVKSAFNGQQYTTYVYEQNGIIHMLAEMGTPTTTSPITKNIGTVLASLESQQVK